MERVEAIEFATLESVHWLNQRRFLEPIGNAPSVELEASYYESTGQLPHGGLTQHGELRKSLGDSG